MRAGLIDSAVASASLHHHRIELVQHGLEQPEGDHDRPHQGVGIVESDELPGAGFGDGCESETVANGGNVGKCDGSDILFTASDGATKLAHEIEILQRRAPVS